MAEFQTKNPNLGKFGRALQWKMLAYFMNIWNSLRPFLIFYGHLVLLVFIWNIFIHLVYFSRFGCLDQEKSGNPAQEDGQLDLISKGQTICNVAFGQWSTKSLN
jgi:hypothetical protein